MTMRDDVLSLWDKDKTKFFSAADIGRLLPHRKIQSIYATISVLTISKEPQLVRRKDDLHGWEYGLAVANPKLIPVWRQPIPRTISRSKKVISPKPPAQPTISKPLPNSAEKPPTMVAEKPAPIVQTVTPSGSVKVTYLNPLAGAYRETKIMWDDSERKKIATLVYWLRKDKGLMLSNAFWEANNYMPKDRQRPYNASLQPNNIPWLIDLIEIHKQNPPPKPIELLPREEPKHEVSEPEIPFEDDWKLEGVPLMALASEFLGRLRPMFKSMIIDALTDPQVIDAFRPMVISPERRQETRHQKHSPLPPADERTKKLKVMVVGLTKAWQWQEIERDYKNLFDIRMMHTDQSTPVMKSSFIQADKIFVLSDHINHRTTFALNSANVKFERLSGQMQKLREALNDYYEQSAK